MVFNPTLESSTRFEQPVSQGPSGVEALSNIVSGLGVFSQRQEGGADNADERFNSFVRTAANELGLDPNPLNWTARQTERAVALSPTHGSKLISLQESAVAGSAGERKEMQTARDSFIDFKSSPMGVSAEMRALELYPQDDQQRERYIAQQYAGHQSSLAAHEQLERQSQQAGFRGNVSEEAWNIELDNIRNVSVDFALDLRNVGHQIINGGQINLEEMAPELAQLTGTRTLSRDNIGSAIAALKANITTQLTRQLREAYPNRQINSPSQAYLDQAFAPLDAVMDAVMDETDPTARLTRLQDQTYFNTLSELSPQGRSVAILYDRWGSNPTFQDVLMTNSEVFGRYTSELNDLISGRNFITPEIANTMSSSEVGASLDLMLSGAQAALASGNPSQQALDDASGFIASLYGLANRQDSGLNTDVYEFLASPNAQRALKEGAFGDDAKTQMAQLVQFDLAKEFDDLRGYVSRTQGSLAMVDGQVVFTNPDRTTDTGMTMPGIPLNKDAQEIIDRINSKLSVMGEGADQGILGTDIETLFSGDATVNGDVSGGMVTLEQMNQTQSTQEPVVDTLLSPITRSNQPVQLTAPRGATQAAPNVWVNSSMNPTLSMEGASSMTQSYAPQRMQAMLEGPFQQMQQIFGGALKINDAIAKAGTSRENNTPGSRHFHGDAIDIDVSGMSDQEKLRLVRAAQEAGFQGFGFGRNILHVDLGAKRSWAYGNNTFGGMSVNELKGWIRDGNFPRPETGGTAQSGQEMFAEELLAQNAAPDSDPGENEPSNFEVFEQQQAEAQEVEQEATRTVTPELQGRRTISPEDQALPEVFDQEILDLIQGLTGENSKAATEEIKRYLQTLQNTEGN